MPPPPREDLPNPDLLERIPLSARVVLDVGCGTAVARRGLSQAQPTRAIARHRQGPGRRRRSPPNGWTSWPTVDVEDDPLPFDVSEGIDCIVYGDILEHLRDPWAVLERQAEALTPDGVILICIPNLEHWSFAEQLLRGTWDYEAERPAGRHASALVQPAQHARGPA